MTESSSNGDLLITDEAWCRNVEIWSGVNPLPYNHKFNESVLETLRKQCEKKKHFLLSSQSFLPIPKPNFNFWVTSIISSAHAFNFEQSNNLKIWSFGKEFMNGLSSYHSLIVMNSLPHNPDFYGPWKRRLLKTLWEFEKMLVTRIFSFPNNFFYPFQNIF